MKGAFKRRYTQILQGRAQDELELINQPITIRDMVLTTPKEKSFGESSRHTNIYGAPPKQRLRDHVRFLFNMANTDHRRNNCETDDNGNILLQEGKENNITRLMMNEFSLYTEVPLKTSDFEALLEDIVQMPLDPNVHVLLSSFALRDENNKIVNMALYIEGGDPPTLHTFAKNTAYSIDITYSREPFSQQKRGHQVSFHAETSAAESGHTISMAGLFECETRGGAKFTQAIDICSDHTGAHARSLAFKRLANSKEENLMPQQVEHIITSNSVTEKSNTSVSDCVIQADPLVRVSEKRDIPAGQFTIGSEDVAALMPTEDAYGALRIEPKEDGFDIRNPIFGSDCHVEVLVERPAAHYVPMLQADLEAHNQRHINEKIGTHLDQDDRKPPSTP